MSIEKFFDGAKAQDIIEFAKILPDEYAVQKKALVEAALKLASQQKKKKEPLCLYAEYIETDPCDV